MIFLRIFSTVFILMVFYRFIRYISTPILQRIGFYKYYSPMFFTMPFFNRVMDIHLGTSWDFLKIRPENPKTMLIYLAEGLLNMSDEIKHGTIKKNQIFRGNTHFLKDITLMRFGFHVKKLNFFEWTLFSLNYLELCLLYSISTKRLTLVPLVNVRIVTCRAEEILEHREKFISIKDKLIHKPVIFDKPADMAKVA